MAVAGFRTHVPQQCVSPSCAHQVRTWPFQVALLRLVLSRRKNHTRIFGGDLHGMASVPSIAREAYALTSDTAAAPAAESLSSDLNDMCTLQLGMLYQLLSRAGTSYRSMRCITYARNFTSVGPGQVKLVRVAKFPVDPGQGEDFQAQQQLLLHTEQSWALQGGSAAVDPSAMIEECLLHREVVALPSSSSLVFPLVDRGLLVGLLVVELETDRLKDSAGSSGGSNGVTAASMGLADQNGPSAAQATASQERGTCPLQTNPLSCLTDEELQCLRLAVPLLAKACGMDARASWQLAQSSANAATARGLLREVQRPLSTLNTFGKMLVPRLKDGDPDKDMAKGILVQGKRLQDLMWQLEDALHGPAVAGSAGLASSAAHAQFTPVTLPGMTGPGTAARSAPPFRSRSALPRDPNPAVQELLSLPQPRPAALLAAGSSQRQQQQSEGPLPWASAQDAPVEGSLQYRSIDAAIGPAELESASPRFVGNRGSAAVLPGGVTFVDRSLSFSPADATSSSSTCANPTDVLTLRQPPVYTPNSQSSAEGIGQSAPGMRPSGRLGSSSSAGTATIDVEMDGCDSNRSSARCSSSIAGLVPSECSPGSALGASGGAVEAACSWGPVHFQGAGGHMPTAVISTNLATALAGVLTAAYRLAAVGGIGFIVNSPLSAVLPRRSSASSASGKSRPNLLTAGDAISSPNASSSGGILPRNGRQERGSSAVSRSGDHPAPAASGPGLIPRPARPLLVGVPAALVQKVVGYMLDIALQCTPRGGQVCVSARQDGAGVQVQVLHSGRMDLQRLHMRSRSMMHPLPAHEPEASALAGPAVAVVPRPAAGLGTKGVGSGSSSGGGTHAGSGVLSVGMAQEILQQAGGHLTVSHPFNMVNAQSGRLDVGTSVEIWLPGPGTSN
ncbi:hypothetical protein Vretimale_15696 [Volvox reticuliferus]|uniref:Uncharacterized protein n=1 Tax=Volvox reticuliferus TaxID=1737510 RepID=A0A8J4LWK4_9CHLO|nr:hypothetical protein Vretimale_15696 [Volvox reticuliferus]